MVGGPRLAFLSAALGHPGLGAGEALLGPRVGVGGRGSGAGGRGPGPGAESSGAAGSTQVGPDR